MAVCAALVVAPPISRGSFKPRRSISEATCTISSSDGVMRPLRPMMSAFSVRRISRIFSHGTMTPEVDDPEAIARQHHADDVLADVMHVAFHRGQHDGGRALLRGLRLAANLPQSGFRCSASAFAGAGFSPDFQRRQASAGARVAAPTCSGAMTNSGLRLCTLAMSNVPSAIASSRFAVSDNDLGCAALSDRPSAASLGPRELHLEAALFKAKAGSRHVAESVTPASQRPPRLQGS